MKNGIIQIAENTWQIRYYWYGMADVYMYLLAGDDRALLIDTGYSETNAINYVKQVTDKPVILVNTHGHFDHCGGNGDFPEAYISEKDIEVYETMRKGIFTRQTMDHVAEMMGLDADQALKKAVEEAVTIRHAPLKTLPEEGYFELGNRKVWFAETPGHTPGSIVLADEKTGILFSGDSVCCQGVLLAFDHSCPVSVYRDSILKMKGFFHQHQLKTIWPSHHETDLSPDLLDEFLTLSEGILNGDVKGVWQDMGTCAGLTASYGNALLVYKEERIQM